MMAPTSLEIPTALGRDPGRPTGPRVGAGAVEATLDGVWLRWIHGGRTEVLRAIYGAVRSAEWDTIEPVVHGLVVRAEPDRAAIDFDAEHMADEIDFTWHGSIRIDRSGSLTFEMDGVARADCLVGRIGICVLHPDTLAGVRLLAETPAGVVESAFPRQIEPSHWLTDLVGMTWQAGPGVEARLKLEGDLFEIEDQRNWTDASFKTFSRSLRLPWPYRLAAGDRVHQVARLMLTGLPRSRRRTRPRPSVRVLPAEHPMPALGVGWPRSGSGFTDPERGAMRALCPAHLRVVVDLGSNVWRDRLALAIDDAASIGAAIEVEAIEGPSARAWVDLASALGRASDVARLLVFSRNSFETGAATLRTVREAIAGSGPGLAGVPIGGGSRENFAELNRTATRLADLDVVGYPIAAAVHASDEASMIETLAGQLATARRAIELADGRPLAVGPVMLRPFSGSAGADGCRPPTPDPRQATLLTAGWLAGSIGMLAAAGASAATYFEGSGPAGFMDGTEIREGRVDLAGRAVPRVPRVSRARPAAATRAPSGQRRTGQSSRQPGGLARVSWSWQRT